MYKRPEVLLAILLSTTYNLQIGTFLEWAMLGSNQRPLPCESSVIVCWTFLEVAKMTLFPIVQEIYSGCCTVAARA
jgi:hypothetical protein